MVDAIAQNPTIENPTHPPHRTFHWKLLIFTIVKGDYALLHSRDQLTERDGRNGGPEMGVYDVEPPAAQQSSQANCGGDKIPTVPEIKTVHRCALFVEERLQSIRSLKHCDFARHATSAQIGYQSGELMFSSGGPQSVDHLQDANWLVRFQSKLSNIGDYESITILRVEVRGRPDGHTLD